MILASMILAILLSHSDPRGIAWCAVGILAGIYLFFNGFRLLKRKKLILDTPASKIRSASLGMVELSGLAAGPYTMPAPITERQCYFYRTVVWEWKRQGRSSRWVKVAGECSHVPFFLDDNTGKVLIDPRGAELDLHCDFKEEYSDSIFSSDDGAPPNVRSFLSRHGLMTGNKIKVEEYCIKPKNAMFVVGTLGENHGRPLAATPVFDDEHTTKTSKDGLWFNPIQSALGEGALTVVAGGDAWRDERSMSEGLMGSFVRRSGFQDSPFASSSLGKSILAEESVHAASAEVIKLPSTQEPVASTGMTQQQKVAAALLKAGISNPAAWAAASAAGTSAATNLSERGMDGFDSQPATVITRGRGQSTFLISWRSQREVARSLGWKCGAMIWLGPALAVLSLYGLLTLIHLV
ncbi:MAG TPA: GIDE domain-containing protein [Candidatus Sulfotelmatobacter sp.]|jgi:hypothetical protein